MRNRMGLNGGTLLVIIAILGMLQSNFLFGQFCQPGLLEKTTVTGEQVCVGTIGNPSVGYSNFSYDPQLDWGKQGKKILVGCDTVIPAKCIIGNLDDNFYGTIHTTSTCNSISINQSFDRTTNYYLYAEFDGSVFQVNGSSQSPVPISSIVSVTLVNTDPETIEKAKKMKVKIKTQKYQKVEGGSNHNISSYYWQCEDEGYVGCSDRTFPENISVTLGGINGCGPKDLESGCFGCEDLNGTYSLTRISSSSNPTYRWQQDESWCYDGIAVQQMKITARIKCGYWTVEATVSPYSDTQCFSGTSPLGSQICNELNTFSAISNNNACTPSGTYTRSATGTATTSYTGNSVDCSHLFGHHTKARLVDGGTIGTITVENIGASGCASSNCSLDNLGGLSIGDLSVTLSANNNNSISSHGSVTNWPTYKSPEVNLGGKWFRVGDREGWSVSGAPYVQGISGQYDSVSFVATDPLGYSYHYSISGGPWVTVEDALDATQGKLTLDKVTYQSQTPNEQDYYYNGNLLDYIQAANGDRIWYSYDTNNMVSRIWAGENADVGGHVDPPGTPTAGRWIDTEYDPVTGLLLSYTHGCGACSGGESRSYEYTNSSIGSQPLVRKVKSGDGSVVYESYQYDTSDRLIRFTLGDDDNGGEKVREWVHSTENDLDVTQKDFVNASQYIASKKIYDSSGNLFQEISYHDLQIDPNMTDPNFTGIFSITEYSSTINGSGQLTQSVVTLPNGSKQITNYDSVTGKVTTRQRSTAAGPAITEMSYYYNGDNIDYTIDERGARTDYTYYDSSTPIWEGLIKDRIEPDPQQPLVVTGRLKTHYIYDNHQRVIEEHQYDTLGNVLLVKTGFKYDDDGNLIRRYDHFNGDFNDLVNNIVTYYEYNQYNQQIKTTTPDGVIRGTLYTVLGQLDSEVAYDPSDLPKVFSQTKYQYQPGTGRLEHKKTAVDTQSFTIDSPSSWIRESYTYDTYGRRKTVTQDADGLALVTTYEYNPLGQIEKTISPMGTWNRTLLDGRGMTKYAIVGHSGDPNYAMTEYVYDLNGNLKEQINPDNTKTTNHYDEFDRLTKVVQGNTVSNLSETIYQYDMALGSQVSRETVNDIQTGSSVMAITEYEYDQLGRRWRTRRRDNLITQDDSKDQISINYYDVSGQVIKTVQEGPGSVDPNVIETHDIVTETYYDELGRTDYVIDPLGQQLHYVYNNKGQLEKMMRDPLDPNTLIVENKYDALGRVYKSIDAEGHYQVRSFNSLGQTIKQVAYDHKGTPGNENDDTALSQTRSEYNGLGSIKRQARMVDASSNLAIDITVDQVTDYGYDSQSQPYPGMLTSQIFYYGGNPALQSLTTYEYDELGRIKKVIDPLGNPTFHFYNTSNKITRRGQIDINPDPLQNDLILTTDYAYDTFGRLQEQRVLPDPIYPNLYLTTAFEYDARNNRTKVTNPKGIITKTEYNALGQQVKATSDLGGLNQVTEFGFDRLGRQISVTGSRDDTDVLTRQTTNYALDKLGQVLTITYPDNTEINYEYNHLGRVKKRTDQRSYVTDYTYDGLGNLLNKSFVHAIQPDVSENFTYDGLGRAIVATKYVDGQRVSYSQKGYSSHGQPIGELSQYFSNPFFLTSFQYDQAGYLLQQFNYVTNETTRYERDPLGRIKKVFRNNGLEAEYEVAEYSYIGNRNKKISFADANLAIDSSYNNYGQLTRILNTPSNPSEVLDFEYTYDDNGHRRRLKYGHLNPIRYDKYSYDNLDRLTTSDYSSSSDWAGLMNQELLDNINYYEDSHLVKMFENLDGFERLSLVSELWCLPEETNLSYSLSQINRDKLGELLGYYFDRDTRSELLSLLFESQFPMVTMMVVDDTLKTQTYEEGKIRTHITTQNNQVLEYNIEKRRSGKYKPVADLKLNLDGHLSSLRMYKPQGGYVDIDLSYDLEGRVQTQTATEYNRKGKPLAEPVMSMFSYEASGEQQSESGPQTPYPTIETFNYDDLGNRQSYVRDIETGYTHSETYTTNDFNQYTQITTDPVLGSIVTASLQYDLTGNLIVDKQGYQYFYDEENRLIGVDDINNNPVVDYEYDAFGRRIRMEDAATNKTTHYYYDMDWRVISEYEMVTAGSEPPKLARSFIYGNGIDEVLGMFCPGTPESGNVSDLTTLGQFVATWLKTSTDLGYNGTFDTNTDNKITLPDFTSLRDGWTYKPAGPEQRWYYMKDGLGSVMGVVGSHSGAESEFYLYDVYGKSKEQSQIGNPYRFTGRRLDVLDNGQFELQYNRNRYYHNDLGRWLNPDPAGYVDGMNLYEYVEGNPIIYSDPSGLVSVKLKFAAFIPKKLGIANIEGLDTEPKARNLAWIPDPNPVNRFFGYYVGTDDRSNPGDKGSSRLSTESIVIDEKDIGNLRPKSQYIFSTTSGESHEIKVKKKGDRLIYVSDSLNSGEANVVGNKGSYVRDRNCNESYIFMMISGSYPLAKVAPAINYNLSFTLARIKCPNQKNGIKITLDGRHNEFPAYEALANDEVFYKDIPTSKGPGIFNLGVFWDFIGSKSITICN